MMPLTETIQRSSAISFPFLGNLTVDPPASFTVFGREIYFYGIIIALAFLIGMSWSLRRASQFDIKKDDVYDTFLWMMPASILGARVYYVLFRLDYYMAHPGEILAVWEGGLAIYGGVIAGVLVIFLVCRHKGIDPLAMIDLFAGGCMLGQSIGRWGNFMNREAFGRETEIFCRMGLTSSSGETIYVHPTFLYESLWNFAGFLFLDWMIRRGKRKYNGQCLFFYFFWYGIGRCWIEGLRTDSLMLFGTGIRVSQLLSAVLAVFGAFMLWKNRKKTCI